MKAFDWENRLAVVATGVVLFGVLAAAESAFAEGDEARVAAKRETAVPELRQTETQRAMAEEAIRAVQSEVQLDLDIQLKDQRSSVRVARVSSP